MMGGWMRKTMVCSRRRLTSIQVPSHPCFDDVISSDVKIPKRFSLLLVVVTKNSMVYYDGVIIILMSNDDVVNKYRRRFLIQPSRFSLR